MNNIFTVFNKVQSLIKVKLNSHSHENGLSRSAVTSASRSFLRPRADGVLPDEPLPPVPSLYNKQR